MLSIVLAAIVSSGGAAPAAPARPAPIAVRPITVPAATVNRQARPLNYSYAEWLAAQGTQTVHHCSALLGSHPIVYFTTDQRGCMFTGSNWFWF